MPTAAALHLWRRLRSGRRTGNSSSSTMGRRSYRSSRRHPAEQSRGSSRSSSRDDEKRPGSGGGRLWLHPMTGGDWLWAGGGLAAVGVLTGGIGAALRALADGARLHPSFLAFEPLGPRRYWNLGRW